MTIATTSTTCISIYYDPIKDFIFMKLHYYLICVVYLYNSYVIALLHCHFYITFYAILYIFEKINATVHQLILINSAAPSKSHYLADLARCHQKACELARSGNMVFSLACLMLFGEYFCLATVLSFSALKDILSTVPGMSSLMTLWLSFILLLMKLAIVIISCKCSGEVRKHFLTILDSLFLYKITINTSGRF